MSDREALPLVERIRVKQKPVLQEVEDQRQADGGAEKYLPR